MVEKKEIAMSCFECMRTLHIYTPKNYHKETKCYPVIYMFDGHNLFYNEDATYGKSWGLMDYLNQENLDVIIVGIECNHEGNRRIEEFSPYDFEDAAIGYIHGLGKELFHWIMTELKPWVDQQYRSIPDREATGIAGSSMGGLMALYGFLAHNDVFSMAGCFSCFLSPIMKDLTKELDSHATYQGRLFISWGSDEFRSKTSLSYATQRNLFLSNQLNAKGAQCFPYHHVKGKHCEACWEEELCYAFPFLLKTS